MLRYDKLISTKGVVASLLIIALLLPQASTAQLPEGPAYVVIGAFAIEKNARKLVEYARSKDIEVAYEIHPDKDLYYVYEYVDQPWQERERIYSHYPEFYDVWVYYGTLGRKTNNSDDSSPTAVAQSQQGEDADMPEQMPIIHSEMAAEASAGIASNEEEPSADTNPEVQTDANDPASMTSRRDADTAPVITNIEPKEGYFYLYFNTVNAKNMKEVKGPVNVIDPVRAKLLTQAKSHEVVELKDPKNGAAAVKASANIFGFREVQHTLNLVDPINDTTSNYIHAIGDSIIVDFELERLKKGDVVVMYNVYFFKDAAIMKPESIYELNALLDMLRENENLVVKLHGHTNGNSHGKIIHLDMEDKNFFSLTATHLENHGSAKKLSEYRAYTIQHWLMDQGISQDRIEIKGWGGKQMIYDKHDTQAYKNVRVEVEIVED